MADPIRSAIQAVKIQHIRVQTAAQNTKGMPNVFKKGTLEKRVLNTLRGGQGLLDEAQEGNNYSCDRQRGRTTTATKHGQILTSARLELQDCCIFIFILSSANTLQYTTRQINMNVNVNDYKLHFL